MGLLDIFRRTPKEAPRPQTYALPSPPPDLPPRVYARITDMMRNQYTLLAGVLRNSDMAFRKDRNLQRMMRHDPEIMSPLTQRLMAIALLDYNIVPDDEDDEAQVKAAEEMKKDVDAMRRRTDFILQLADACWYGPAAANVIYDRNDEGRVVPKTWLPIHPDSLQFTETGDLGMKVSWHYKGSTVITYGERTHLFTPDERQAIVLHTWMPQGPDYDVAEQARYNFSGRGLRDTVWFHWQMKGVALQHWMTAIERYGLGTRIGRYPDGNSVAKDAMAETLRNLMSDVSVLVPDDRQQTGLAEPTYGIEVLDHLKGGSGAKVFADLIAGYLSGLIKELIIGQTATTEATNSGLGSDVATRHAQTFQRIIKYDSMCLADTLTHELLRPLHVMNHGSEMPAPRWEFPIEDIDSHEFLEGVEKFVAMGGTVSIRSLRDRLGFEEPMDDEDTLGGMDPMMSGVPGQGQPFGGDLDSIRNAVRSRMNGTTNGAGAR